MLVEANSKPHDIVTYTDGSATRDRSGWGFTIMLGGRTVYEDSGDHSVTTSSLTMEVEAVTHAIQWLASQRDAQITRATILTRWSLEWAAPTGTQPSTVFGYKDFCPGHAGVNGNKLADRLASTTDTTSGLQLGRAKVFRGLRNFLNTYRPEHHITDRLKEREVEKGSGPHSTLRGQERSVFNQTNRQTLALF